jgi:hypothetical protein
VKSIKIGDDVEISTERDSTKTLVVFRGKHVGLIQRLSMVWDADAVDVDLSIKMACFEGGVLPEDFLSYLKDYGFDVTIKRIPRATEAA